jgi:hypothetical protein
MVDAIAEAGPWEWDEKFTVGVPMEPGVYYFRLPDPDVAKLISLAPELRNALAKMVDWLEGSEVFATTHGAHSDTVEAKKLLARLEATA